jgi:hypothetical protein
MNRAASYTLLAGGLLLVFAGLSAALGFSTSGMLASAAAIVALLYAGGVWFGAASCDDGSIVLFTRGLTVAHGPFAGRPVRDLFPGAPAEEIEARCREALDGHRARFSCGTGPARRTFSANPVRIEDGVIMYGVLTSDTVTPAVTRDRLTPVA